VTICHRVKILVDDRSVAAAAAAAAGPFCGLLPVSSYWIRRGRVGENGRIEPILTVRTYLWFLWRLGALVVAGDTKMTPHKVDLIKSYTQVTKNSEARRYIVKSLYVHMIGPGECTVI
jgi:hypothetical protein